MLGQFQRRHHVNSREQILSDDDGDQLSLDDEGHAFNLPSSGKQADSSENRMASASAAQRPAAQRTTFAPQSSAVFGHRSKQEQKKEK